MAINSKRTVKYDIVSTCEPAQDVPRTGILDWMLTQIAADEPAYLLAHFDDGVVWGRRAVTREPLMAPEAKSAAEEETSGSVGDGRGPAARPEAAPGKWVTSHDRFPGVSPEPRDIALLQARAFHARGELLVWRDGENRFHAVLTSDRPIEGTEAGSEYLDEPQKLWGDTPEGDPVDGFQLWREGSQGLRHALPLTAYSTPDQKQRANADAEKRPVKLPPLLVIRHYLANDAAARIEHSRILGFDTESAQWFVEAVEAGEDVGSDEIGVDAEASDGVDLEFDDMEVDEQEREADRDGAQTMAAPIAMEGSPL